MELLDFLKTLTGDEQAEFAVGVGTTLPHLRNVAYGSRVASAALARQISLRSEGRVPVSILRPKDWHLIWGSESRPINSEGAPPVPQTTEEVRDAA